MHVNNLNLKVLELINKTWKSQKKYILQFFVQLLFGVPERYISGFNLFGNFLDSIFLALDGTHFSN